MPYANILDKKTGKTFKALDFGGPYVYKVSDKMVHAPQGGTSVTFEEKVATLNPLNLTSVLEDRWEIISHQDIGTSNWRVTVKNHSTQEVKTGVYPFNLNGTVYELKDCAPGTWVIASCGGYKIESSWNGKTSNQAFRLKGNGEIIYKFKFKVEYTDIFEYLGYFFLYTDVLTDQDFINSGMPLVSNTFGIRVGGSIGSGLAATIDLPGLTKSVPCKPIPYRGNTYAISQTIYNQLVADTRQKTIQQYVTNVFNSQSDPTTYSNTYDYPLYISRGSYTLKKYSKGSSEDLKETFVRITLYNPATTVGIFLKLFPTVGSLWSLTSGYYGE